MKTEAAVRPARRGGIGGGAGLGQRRGPGHGGTPLRGPRQQGRHPSPHRDHAEGTFDFYTRSRLYGHRIYGLFGLYGQFLSGPNLPEYTKN